MGAGRTTPRGARRSFPMVARRSLAGALLTLLAITGIELVSRTALRVPSLTVLLTVVALVAFINGLRPGLLSAALVAMYGAYYFSIPDQPFRYADGGVLPVVLLLPTAASVALAVGALREAVREREADLRRQLEFSRALDRSLAEGVYAVDREGRATLVNPAAERLLGWTEAELRGQVMHDAIHHRRPDGTPYPAEECAGLRVLRGGVSFRTEDDAFIRRDGTPIPVAYSSSPIEIAGQVVGAVIAFRDIGERKRAEDALRESAAKLHLITAQIPAYGWLTDRDLRITSTFGSGLAQLGLDPDTFVGKALVELRGEVSETAVAHRRAVAGEATSYALRLVDRDLEARVEPLQDGAGRVVGCLGLAVDVTERRRHERRLAAQSEVSRALAEAPGLDEAAPAVIRAIGEHLEWDYGGLWTVDRGGGVLRCVATWHDPALDLAAFVAVTRGAAFPPGVGLPGHVWRDGGPRWVADAAAEGSFPRLVVAGELGLRSGLGVPIAVDGQVVGVLEFLTREARAVDRDVQAVLAALAAQVGQFIERKRAEEALRASEERFRSAFAESAVGHALAALDGRIIEVNRAFCAITGRDEATLLGVALPAITHPDDRERFRHRVAQVVAGERAHFQIEERYLREDGGAVPVLCDVAAVRDARGRPQFLIALVQDITERRLAQAALGARARQQATVARLGQRALATPELAAVLDEAVAVVAATLDVEYAKVLELLPGGDALLLRAGIGWREGLVGHATVGADAESQAGYTLLSRAPVIVADLRGEARFSGPPLLHDHGVVSGLSVVIPGAGRPFGVLGAHTSRSRVFSPDDSNFFQAVANILASAIARQAYERRLAAEEVAARASRDEAARLAELDRLRREFISSVSHELRTPLTALGLGISLLAPLVEGRASADEGAVLGVMRRNIDRLMRYVDDLLLVNRLDAGVLRLDRRPLDLRAAAADAAAAIRPLLEGKGQAVTLDLPEPLPVAGDAERLEQVLINLLGNAHYHTPAGTRVAVSGRAVDGEVRLTVRDDGPGIPAADLERVFARFQRLGKEDGGSGLGLVVARSIVELHGGRIWAESPPGEGATFHLALPGAEPRQGAGVGA
ncbi:MAG: diguanylate cyclase/phosphodiesterase (GGDEF & EAL domains) with PAS/PAC sensor(s) [uncultured Gemmatimonadaceae bacterium]|uniref:histidine kinase n=1 Tax=uncultured Gemmatimonadaceae bacterium TaxID=246130 RepID=A0A6J4L8L0_9BACT|nr:MAG: diguanylate cyclase/phosphodiesterase (GGDEF & EAL domains) with PAS/PAC sensor(s) [uncultured Gemmatimonadaceae bacterium]